MLYKQVGLVYKEKTEIYSWAYNIPEPFGL